MRPHRVATISGLPTQVRIQSCERNRQKLKTINKCIVDEILDFFVLRLHQVAASLRRLLTGGIQMSTSEGRQLLSILQILEVLNILTCIKFRYNKYYGEHYNLVFPLASGIQRSTTEGIPVAHAEAASFHLVDIGPFTC